MRRRFLFNGEPNLAQRIKQRFLRICYRSPNYFLNAIRDLLSMIPPQLVDLLQTGVSIIVGTRDSSLMPESTRAWGILVGENRASVTIFLTEAISKKTLQNLKDNGLVAISCTRPTDHVACQLKGRMRTIRPAGQADREHSKHWHREFTQELVAIGVPADMCDAWMTEPALAVEIDVTDVFHQTPGPGAGEKA